MRTFHLLNENWIIHAPDGSARSVNLPFCSTGPSADSVTASCRFTAVPHSENEQVWLEIGGAGVKASVTVNGKPVITHDGANTRFRCDITDTLAAENELTIELSSVNASRLFLRDVQLITVNRHHFDLGSHGGDGLAVCPDVVGREKNADIWVRTWHNAEDAGTVHVTLINADGEPVAEGDGTELDLIVKKAHRWDGIKDPYLYTCRASLIVNEEVVDEISCQFGVRSFRIDPKLGFFLNDHGHPLRGVCRYQDHPESGLALTREQHEADIRLLREMGATAVRLMGRPHDPAFLDLCDQHGLVVLTDFFCPSTMPTEASDVLSLHTQMTESVIQQYNHPSICIWGISSDLDASRTPLPALTEVFNTLNSCIEELDPSRPTAFCCSAGDGLFDKLSGIGALSMRSIWYGARKSTLSRCDLWLKAFHMFNSKRCLALGEYGCAGRLSHHTTNPVMGDESEEYQAVYHEYMLRCRENHSYLWGTFLSALADLASDDAGNDAAPALHQGLTSADRTTRKDAFYLYKAQWSREPFVHICSKRVTNRPGKLTLIKVYSNSPDITLYVNGREYAKQHSSRIFLFRVPISGEIEVEAVAGYYRDKAVFRAE